MPITLHLCNTAKWLIGGEIKWPPPRLQRGGARIRYPGTTTRAHLYLKLKIIKNKKQVLTLRFCLAERSVRKCRKTTRFRERRSLMQTCNESKGNKVTGTHLFEFENKPTCNNQQSTIKDAHMVWDAFFDQCVCFYCKLFLGSFLNFSDHPDFQKNRMPSIQDEKFLPT